MGRMVRAMSPAGRELSSRVARKAAVAIEETHAEPLLDLHHLLTHHGRREIEPIGRGGEAAGLDNLAEDPDALQRVHAASLRD